MVPSGERRKRIRHKLHTPVYASFSEMNEGMVLDLSELTDLHEEGFAVRTSELLEPGKAVKVCLDLPETKNYIHGSGHVVWSDGKGRAGVRLPGLAEDARRLLQEWLFVNLLIAAANHKARSEQRALIAAKDDKEEASVATAITEPSFTQAAPGSPVADLSTLLFAVDAVRRELQSYKGDITKAFSLIADRALSLTGASGAALAIKTADQMVCRASAGDLAPPLESVVDVRHGFSGECVRTAATITCADSETDARVDHDVCRMLGIRSMMATPIFSDVWVVGLLEVFSPRASTFSRAHETVLEKLAELVPIPAPAAPAEPPIAPVPASPLDDISPPGRDTSRVVSETQQRRAAATSIGRMHFWLLAATVAVASLGLGYVLAPVIERHWFAQPQTAVHAASAETSANSKSASSSTLENSRRLAEQGDAAAQWDLGVRYHHGDGVPQDDALAVQWFERAAAQGYVLAQGALGADYWAGRGVSRDLSKSYFWSTLAMVQGDETSRSRLEGLASQMTRAEVLAARQQADDWIRLHAAKNKAN